MTTMVVQEQQQRKGGPRNQAPRLAVLVLAVLSKPQISAFPAGFAAVPFAQASVTQFIDLELEEDAINARAAFAAQIEQDSDGCPFCKNGCERCRWGSSDEEG